MILLDIEKEIQLLEEKLNYIQDIFAHKENENILLLQAKLNDFISSYKKLTLNECRQKLSSLKDLFSFLENKLDRQLTPMDKVRIVRHPQRICLKDILENVYDNYTEIGGQDEYSIDPSMLIARAYITRKVGNKVYHQPVMVIGQEKGHGEEFRNGGSVKPWGNAKALQYMKVAERENIPIHTYVFTPGAYPIEDYPGAAQQIARNLYEMAGIKVPIVAVFSEGGSGGAEAIALADMRLMLSHGYYSVISPEGAAAIEGKIRGNNKASLELIEKCAAQLKITADDNLVMGYIDRIIKEPPLGARPEHFDFFKTLRNEVIKATDEVVLKVRGISLFRSLALRKLKNPDIYVRWNLSSKAKQRLLETRYKKFRNMSKHAYIDNSGWFDRLQEETKALLWTVYGLLRYDFFKRHQQKISQLAEDIKGEAFALVGRLQKKLTYTLCKIPWYRKRKNNVCELVSLSEWKEEKKPTQTYTSPQAKIDKAITCPNAEKEGCLDQWAPDLFGDLAGVCAYCGHHFPMEHEWYLYNVFDANSIHEFNSHIEAGNPLDFEGFSHKLKQAKQKTGHKSACLTFEASIQGVEVVVAVLMAKFRGGTVGAAEGEKFIRAVERANLKYRPFIAYVHGTAGIRIQEGTNGVIQMPRCTMAIRRYLEEGGLYIVVYDTNSYAGPVASFLGCSPYQFAIRSSNLGFAGPGVIKETTGIEIPPDYHKAYHALSRGHIQGIWDRRQMRDNLYQALLTMGGRRLYYQ
ncbi:acetyl-CoA carboxylase carboxyl transferase subunit beta [Desulfonauticus submarinus]|uniref:Acetyl-coenzyme A carboxylase carboxyl transferase subunits beta/alpha n=1 Tax=Desulfonauticus submarinus TaxID=206665 RepID=A0A1H0F1M5_9BACT|nr:carboxyl transferase domain-containing protein [Desulfonauticus submarinus]SDN88532.1 acetyl-CoA carboxylase carboxyl transferase subunit beta [Desulfonauticus submarinus]